VSHAGAVPSNIARLWFALAPDICHLTDVAVLPDLYEMRSKMRLRSSKNLSENLHGRVVPTVVELQGRVTSRQMSSRSDDAADRLLSSQPSGTLVFASQPASFIVADICSLLLTP
jgi:hypothetical protein